MSFTSLKHALLIKITKITKKLLIILLHQCRERQKQLEDLEKQRIGDLGRQERGLAAHLAQQVWRLRIFSFCGGLGFPVA